LDSILQIKGEQRREFSFDVIPDPDRESSILTFFILYFWISTFHPSQCCGERIVGMTASQGCFWTVLSFNYKKGVQAVLT